MSKPTLLAVLVLVLTISAAYGQTGVGQIQGTVTDSSGAVVPNANVTLRRVQTGEEFKTTTSATGFFTFPTLRAGLYEITVSVPGMKKWEGQVSLQVGQTAVVDPALAVAGVAEQVTIAGDVTPLVTTTSPTLATVWSASGWSSCL